jgi:hypothetical protein
MAPGAVTYTIAIHRRKGCDDERASVVVVGILAEVDEVFIEIIVLVIVVIQIVEIIIEVVVVVEIVVLVVEIIVVVILVIVVEIVVIVEIDVIVRVEILVEGVVFRIAFVIDGQRGNLFFELALRR